MRSDSSAQLRVAAGPKGHLLFGSLPDLQRDPLALLTSARAEYGDVVRFRYLGPRAWHFFAHPTHVEEILVTRYQDFPKGVFARVLDLIIPRALVTTEGAEWSRQRRLLQPGFAPARLEGLVQTIVAVTHEHTAGWSEYLRRGEPLDISTAMLRLAFVAAGRTLFGSDLEGLETIAERYVRMALAQIDARVLHPLSPLPFLPTPRKLAYRAAARHMDRLVGAIIERRRRAGPPERTDLMAMLLEARDADTGEALNDAQIRDHVRTLLITSYETTGVSLGWLFYNLAANPDVAERVRSEIDAVLGDRLPAFADLTRLVYARQVIDETLRLYPAIFWAGRQAARHCELGGYSLPKNGVVCLSPFVTHRHPDFWKTPDRFDPDNFAPARAAALARGAYLPFGLGPRHCIGKHLALLEMLIILCMVLSRWRLALAPGPHVEPVVRGTLQPSSPITVLLAPAPPSGTHAPAYVVAST